MFNPDAHVESRRSFLAKTAALAGAGALVAAAGTSHARPVPVKGLSRPPLEEGGVIKIGVIGTGGMGTGHCDGFINSANAGAEKVQIVAVCDVCQSHLDRAYDKCVKGQKDVTVERTTDYRKVLAREDIHGVLIATPEHWHSKMAIDAIAAGKDVYIEKPMTLRLEEAVTLHDTALANPSTIVQIGTQQVRLPKFIEAQKLIAQGMIGTPTMSQTSYCRNNKEGEWLYYAIDPAWEPGKNLDWDAWCGPLGKIPWDPQFFARWRRYKAFSTGIIGDLLVHVLTPLMYAVDAGWPTRVTCAGGHYVDKVMENHDTINMTIEFEKGHTMIVAGSTNNETGLEVLIRGHKGNVYLGGRHCVVRPERIFSEELESKTIQCDDIGNDQDQHRLGWLRSIRTREKPIADVVLSTKVMVAVDLATRSAWDGHAYKFDPASMKALRV